MGVLHFHQVDLFTHDTPCVNTSAQLLSVGHHTWRIRITVDWSSFLKSNSNQDVYVWQVRLYFRYLYCLIFNSLRNSFLQCRDSLLSMIFWNFRKQIQPCMVSFIHWQSWPSGLLITYLTIAYTELKAGLISASINYPQAYHNCIMNPSAPRCVCFKAKRGGNQWVRGDETWIWYTKWVLKYFLVFIPERLAPIRSVLLQGPPTPPLSRHLLRPGTLCKTRPVMATTTSGF